MLQGMDPEAGSPADPRLLTSQADANRRNTIDTIHAKPLPLMTVHDAIEEILETGNGAWAWRCVGAATMNLALIGAETVVSTYLVSCLRGTFDLTSTQSAVIPSVNLFGSMIGGLVLNPLADIHGRKTLMMWCSGGIAFCCLLTAFAPTFHLFLVARMCTGFFEGSFMVACSLVAEFVSTEKRGMITNFVSNIAWGFGSTALNLTAWLIIPHYGWRVLLVATAIPVFLNIFQIYMLVESPRWLMSQGRVAEAFASLDYMAENNGTFLPCSWLIAPPTSSHESTPLAGTDAASTTRSGEFWRMLARYRILFKGDRAALVCTLSFLWAAGQFAYFSAVFYDTDVLGTKKGMGTCQFDYAFDTFVGTAEIFGGIAMMPLLDSPDYSPWLGGRVGKQMSSFFVGTTCLLLMAYSVQPVAIWAYVSRGLLSGAVGVQLIHGAELFDAECRATAVGYLTAVGMLGSVFSPYWVFSGYSPHVVALGIALAIFISMIMTFMIPETAGKQLDRGSFEHLAELPELPWLSNREARTQGVRHSAPALLSEKM